MQFFVGTSGYGYKEWKGKFYPEKLPPAQMLRYYAERMNSVELNNTYRKMPTAESLAALLPQVPKSFRFVVKAPMTITHMKRLKGVEAPLDELKSAIRGLKVQRGPVLFQFPANFKCDLERLNGFLRLLNKQTQAAFEFRHESWFQDDVWNSLAKRGCAWCVDDADELPPAELIHTTDWGYLRLRRAKYTTRQLSKWLERILAQNWKAVHVFFKHEETATGPKLAGQFLELVEKLG